MKEQNKKDNKKTTSPSPADTKKQNKVSTTKKAGSLSKTKSNNKVALPKFEYKNLLEDDNTQNKVKQDISQTDTANQKPAKEKRVKEKSKEQKSIKETKQKKKFNKRAFVSTLVLFVLGISSGLFAGNWYATNFIAGPPTDYSQFTEVELRAGNDKIAKDFANKEPNASTAWKSFIAAEANASSATSFDILSNGLIDTIVTQTAYSRKIYDGERVYVEQISDGLVAVAEKFVYTPSAYILENKDTHIVRTKGKLNGTTTIDDYLKCDYNCKHGNKNATIYNTTYNSEVSTMTEAEYVEALGSLPLSPINYIVSEKTVLSCGDYKKVGSGDDTRYQFTMYLHSGASVLNYVKQMKTVSGLSDYPSFTEVKLSVSLQMIDGKVMFDYICVNEKYSVPYGSLTPKCTGTLHQRFLFNGDYSIPA